MRTKSLILIFIALACGLVASIGISQVLQSDTGNGPQVDMVPILVAMTDIDIGGKLDANNVKLEEWPKTKIPEAALTSLDKLDDQYARVRLYKGEALMESKLMGSTGANTAIKIPKGFRAVPLKIEQDTVIGLIQPGDKVDVMVIVRRSDTIPFDGAVTFLKDVRVFSVGGDVERTVDKDGKQVEAKTVSLLVKQNQAQQVTLAAEMGKIRLTLRRPDEVDDEITDGQVTFAQLLGTSSSGSTQPADGGRKITDILTNTPAVEPPTAAPVATVASTAGKFHMEIMGPGEVKRFEWQSREELPVELLPPGMTSVNGQPTVPAAAIPPGLPSPSQLPGLPMPEPDTGR